ncbi:hypothetical protein DSAG12_02565 [Promethearchaeum syntrophicum]|uniref:Uncharacterized protein n=1 Tax=Promethearchaeum syntrophicum TaxID=2594042 RepID=A0A5B9DCJ8_9ARCH|nr:hypothetical protein [Candidatus Prometheoarchaeum syntrophicum]
MPSKPSKTRQPDLNDRLVFNYINQQIEPISYHDIQKSKIVSPGILQATVTRCLNPDSKFRIYEGKKISKQQDRLIRLFSTNPTTLSSLELPNLSNLIKIYENIIDGNIFEAKNDFFLPLKMDEYSTQILKELVKISPHLESIGDLFSKALEKYLEESVTEGLIDQAKQIVEENRK